MNLVKTILDRIEPWAIFLSILGILFVPWGKGLCWAILVVVGLVRIVRAWREAWHHFSLETIGEVVSAGASAVAIVLLYFFLHHTFPGFVHDRPRLSFAPSYALALEGSQNHGALRLRPEDGGYRVEFGTLVGDHLPHPATGILTRDDLIVGYAMRFRDPLPVRKLGGPFARGARRGAVRLTASGAPLEVTLYGLDGARETVLFHGIAQVE